MSEHAIHVFIRQGSVGLQKGDLLYDGLGSCVHGLFCERSMTFISTTYLDIDRLEEKIYLDTLLIQKQKKALAYLRSLTLY